MARALAQFSKNGAGMPTYTYVVTPANWNDPAFWSTVDVTDGSPTPYVIDFDNLTDAYSVDLDPGVNGLLTLEFTDTFGVTTTFTVASATADAGVISSADAVLGGISEFSFFANITGSEGADNLELGDAGNRILAGDGNDTVEGNKGNDQLYGQGGDDRLEGDRGDDSLIGGQGADRLDGGRDNDVLFGNTGDDTLLGGRGDDELLGGAGADSIDGGEGTDVVDYSGSSTGVDVDLEDGTGSGGDAEGDTFENVENVIGSFLDDTITGNSDDNFILALDGDDLITTGDGNDTLAFLPGNGTDTVTDFDSAYDFIDLSAFYDALSELRGDYADDGVLNQSNEDTAGGTDYSDNAQFLPGDGIILQGLAPDGSELNAQNTAVCFAAGTLIRTPAGDIPVEKLRVGDLVTTKDNGPKRLLWSVMRALDNSALEAAPHLKPVLLQAGALGGERPLIVSPQHGVVKMINGEEVLVRAKHLAEEGEPRVRRMRGARSVTYVHLMFEQHEIIFAEGRPAESFYPGPMALRALQPDAIREFIEIFPVFAKPPPVRGTMSDAWAWDRARTLVTRRQFADMQIANPALRRTIARKPLAGP